MSTFFETPFIYDIYDERIIDKLPYHLSSKLANLHNIVLTIELYIYILHINGNDKRRARKMITLNVEDKDFICIIDDLTIFLMKVLQLFYSEIENYS